MSSTEIVLTVLAVLLALAALPTVHRIVVGPTILDRTVATDMLVVLMVLGLALYSAGTRSTWAVTAMLSLTAFAFVGTVAVARFVAREEPRGARGRSMRQAETAGTGTGAHDAIHPEVAQLEPDEAAEPAHAVQAEDEIWQDEPEDETAGALEGTVADQDLLADVTPPGDDRAADVPAEIDAEEEAPTADALAEALDDGRAEQDREEGRS